MARARQSGSLTRRSQHRMADLVVVFRTHSDIEAHIVRSLLESHGVRSLLASDIPHTIFPVNVDGLGEVRISVTNGQAEEARRIIESHRKDATGRVLRLRDEFKPLEAAVGYQFRDQGLIEHALTHRSRAHEDVSGGVIDNESLEFLGDAVLGFVIAAVLFREFPDYDEGRKSKLKALLVSAPTLARLGQELAIGNYLLLGRGEEKSGGRRKHTLIGDTFEALIAAIYLDGGVVAAQDVIERLYRPLVAEAAATGRVASVAPDSKSALQEWLQSHGRSLPEYRLARTTGPDHAKRFLVEVNVDGAAVGAAEGGSKKEAEQLAASRALEHLAGSA